MTTYRVVIGAATVQNDQGAVEPVHEQQQAELSVVVQAESATLAFEQVEAALQQLVDGVG